MTSALAFRYTEALVGASILTLMVTPLLRRLALRYDIVDYPAARKSHAAPTPYLGGLGLIAAVLLGLAFAPSVPIEVGVVVAGGLAVGAIGLVDDKRALAPGPRIVVQVLAASCAVGVGIRVHVTGVTALDIGLTIAWIVLLTNAFNLLDNMDGLSAGTTVVGGTAVFALAAAGTQHIVASAAAGLVGGCLGFLAYNKRPASIFMGDAGALVLGYVMSILAVQVNSALRTPDSFVVPLLLLWLPAMDTSFVVFTRLRQHRPVLTAGKDHLSHRLVARGHSPGRAVLLLLCAYAVVTAAAVAGGREALPIGASAAVALAASSALLVHVRQRASSQRSYARRPSMHRPITAGSTR